VTDFLVSIEVDETELSAAVTALAQMFDPRAVGVQRSPFNIPTRPVAPKPQSVGAAAVKAEPKILTSEPTTPATLRSEAMRRAWETRRANKAAAAAANA